jgi:hypothetical protein
VVEVRNGRGTGWCRLLLALIAAGALALPAGLPALCLTPQEEGSWRNVDSGTRSLTRVELRFVCQDQILNGQPYPPGPPWYFKAWGRCHPTDCEWAEVGGDELGSGFVYFTVDHGFARRYVYARMSTVYPGRLWVWMWTDFVDPARPDYSSSNYFERSGG